MAAGIPEFARAFTSNLLSKMSGGASVPFAGLGLWLGDKWQAYLFFGLAALCVVLAAFFMWRKERERADELTERIRPKLKCSFDMSDEACVVRDVPVVQAVGGTYVEVAKVDYFRLEVATDNAERVSNCQGRLLWVERDANVSRAIQ